jgi:nucleotide-binding universal stress UspA family protein
METIVIATDGSPSAHEAVDFGLQLARQVGAAVVFVHVTHSREDGADRKPLGSAAVSATSLGVRATTELLVGDPADEIVTYADTIDADAIVVGSRGHGPLKGALLGSVSQRVLRDARLPVLVVPGLRQTRTENA